MNETKPEAPEDASTGSAVVIGGAGLALVDALAILYLALPVALFLVLWFRPIFGVPLAVAALAGLTRLIPLANPFQPLWAVPSARAILVAAVVACVWTALGGIGHIFYANHFDWVMRDAVLRDLVVHPAPVAYQDGSAVAILRAPVAYYIVPALIGKLGGLRAADVALYLWTVLGVGLFLLQLFAGERRPGKLWLMALVAVASSGLDILAKPSMLLDATGYKGFWAQYYQYPSMTANLFWAPNHALPAWLGIALICRGRDDPRFVGLAAWIGALTLLWSPIVSIGLLPFFGLIFWRRLGDGQLAQLATPVNLVAAPLITAAAFLYLTAAAGTIVTGLPAAPDLVESAITYVKFVVLEFLAMALVLWRRHRAGIDLPFFAAAIATLLIIPFFRFGPGNDLAARGSAPALVVILIAVIDGWARRPPVGKGTSLVFVLLCIGAFTPLSEMTRALTQTAWPPDPDRSVYDMAEGNLSNYLMKPGTSTLLDRLLLVPMPIADCSAGTDGRPGTGTILRRKAAGKNAAVLVNELDQDAAVEFRASDFGTAVAVYVRAHETASLADLPDGEYLVNFTSGAPFSRTCRMFLGEMDSRLFYETAKFPDPSGQPARFVLTTHDREAAGGRTGHIAREFSLFN